jgi:hypothetical protein
MEYLITSRQALSAALRAGLRPERLNLSGVAVLTFSRGVVERLSKLCELEDLPTRASLCRRTCREAREV